MIRPFLFFGMSFLPLLMFGQRNPNFCTLDSIILTNQSFDNDSCSLEFFTTGELKNINRYRLGQRHGQNLTFFKTGNIETIAFFEDGQKTGEYLIFHENGRMRARMRINKDRIVYHAKFSEEGVLRYEELYGIGELNIINIYDEKGIIESQTKFK